MPDLLTNETNSSVRIPAEVLETDFTRRVGGALVIYRLMICGVLLLAYFLAVDPPAIGAHERQLFLIVSLIYLAFSLLAWFWRGHMHRNAASQLQWMLLVDIFAITLLMHASGGIQSGLGTLLIIAVGATAMVLGRRNALVFAALASIAILMEQVVSRYEGIAPVSDFIPAGALGATIFLIAVFAQPLAKRLRETEELAAQQGVDLANLNELNRYIVQHLRESIVVIDEEDRVRLMNDSAGGLLGAKSSVENEHLSSVSPELHRLTVAWRLDTNRVSTSYGNMRSADGSAVITPHFAPIGAETPSPTTIFLENTSQLAERVQQTKLAALGRLSASIAHEIRNPVGAISHASQLLAEADGLQPEDHRLTAIIRDHCVRVSDIIRNVLEFSKRDHTRPQKIELNAWLREFIRDFLASSNLTEAQLKFLPIDRELVVRVDPAHLQRVLWNLVDNAQRYGQQDGPPEFEIHTGRQRGNSRPYLDVLDRGPGISDDKVEHIFEPFFTNAADGTGLGLFIARELCECNQATLAYEHRDGGGSSFRVVFSDPERWVV